MIPVAFPFVDCVHLISFSLILLNTDLHKNSTYHSSMSGISRMNKKDFIQNTLMALREFDLLDHHYQVMEHILKYYYTQIKHMELQNPPITLLNDRTSSIKKSSSFSEEGSSPSLRKAKLVESSMHSKSSWWKRLGGSASEDMHSIRSSDSNPVQGSGSTLNPEVRLGFQSVFILIGNEQSL
jgi:Sec7-like guanine-nucleotide exchange factor